MVDITGAQLKSYSVYLSERAASTTGVSMAVGLNTAESAVVAVPPVFANVKDYGAAGDGVADDTAEIQAACTAASIIYFPPGTYKITSAITVTGKPILIMGAGVAVTEIVCDAGGFVVNNSSLNDETSVTILDLALTSTTAGTQTAISITGTSQRTTIRSQMLIERVALRGSGTGFAWQKGIVGTNVSDSRIANVSIVGDRDDWGLMDNAIQIASSVDISFSGLRLYWGGTAMYFTGDAEGMMLSQYHFVGFEIGYHVLGTGSAAMHHISQGHMNTNQRAVFITSSDATASRHSDISSNNFLHNVPSVSLVGGVTDYDWIGVEIDGEQSQVSNNAIEGSLARTDTGVIVDGLSDNLIVSDNYIGGCSSKAVEVQSGATDCIVRGNTGASSALIVNSGTRTRLTSNEDNLWADEVHGGATVLNATTSIVVSHTLSSTPSIADIQITARSWGNAAKAWVSNVTSTQFTINVDVDPGASNAAFTWWAKTSKSNL